MNIYVGNLSPETSVSVLRGSFEAFGTVANVTISTYLIDGKPRSLGFVEMPSKSHGRAAIVAMEGKELGGSPLRVREE